MSTRSKKHATATTTTTKKSSPSQSDESKGNKKRKAEKNESDGSDDDVTEIQQIDSKKLYQGVVDLVNENKTLSDEKKSLSTVKKNGNESKKYQTRSSSSIEKDKGTRKFRFHEYQGNSYIDVDLPKVKRLFSTLMYELVDEALERKNDYINRRNFNIWLNDRLIPLGLFIEATELAGMQNISFCDKGISSGLNESLQSDTKSSKKDKDVTEEKNTSDVKLVLPEKDTKKKKVSGSDSSSITAKTVRLCFLLENSGYLYMDMPEEAIKSTTLLYQSVKETLKRENKLADGQDFNIKVESWLVPLGIDINYSQLLGNLCIVRCQDGVSSGLLHPTLNPYENSDKKVKESTTESSESDDDDHAKNKTRDDDKEEDPDSGFDDEVYNRKQWAFNVESTITASIPSGDKIDIRSMYRSVREALRAKNMNGNFNIFLDGGEEDRELLRIGRTVSFDDLCGVDQTVIFTGNGQSKALGETTGDDDKLKNRPAKKTKIT